MEDIQEHVEGEVLQDKLQELKNDKNVQKCINGHPYTMDECPVCGEN